MTSLYLMTMKRQRTPPVTASGYPPQNGIDMLDSASHVHIAIVTYSQKF